MLVSMFSIGMMVGGIAPDARTAGVIASLLSVSYTHLDVYKRQVAVVSTVVTVLSSRTSRTS